MTQTEKVYGYLKKNYSENEPVLLSELNIPGMSSASVRQQLKKLTADKRIKRYDTGIYYLPKESIFRSGATLSADSVIRKKYLMDGAKQCGYISGMLFANRIGITTQVPTIYEIFTNKATTDYREVRVADLRVAVRRPCVKVTAQNADVLQFLDLLKDVAELSEIEGKELTVRLLAYMKKAMISFNSLKPYLEYYPERIYKNMYKVGLLNGVSA